MQDTTVELIHKITEDMLTDEQKALMFMASIDLDAFQELAQQTLIHINMTIGSIGIGGCCQAHTVDSIIQVCRAFNEQIEIATSKALSLQSSNPTNEVH